MTKIKNLIFILNLLIFGLLATNYICSMDVITEKSNLTDSDSGSDSKAVMSFDDLEEDLLKDIPEEPELIKLINSGDTNGVVQAVAKGADVNSKSNSGKSALQLAMDKNLADIVYFLSSKGAKVNKTLSNNAEFKKVINSKLEFPIHNLIMLFDNSESFEGKIKTNRFVVNQLFLAQSQEVCPILVSGNTLRLSLQILSKEKADKDLQKVVPLSDKYWDFYKAINEDIYLLVPKKYLQNKSDLKFSSDALKEFTHDALSIGFKIDKKDVLEKILLESINLSLIKKPTNNQIIDINALKSIFIKKEDLEPYFKQDKFASFKHQEQINKALGIWNIYLSGHGMYSKKYLSLVGSEKDIKKISEHEQSYDAEIAGISLQNFRDLIKFLNSNINVNFLYYISCYAGGYNLMLPYIEDMGQVLCLPKFTIAVGSVTDSVVKLVTNLPEESFSNPEKIKSGKRDLISFFNELSRYVNKDLSPAKLNDEQLQSIFSFIVPKDITNLTLSYYPQIMLPGSGAFKLLTNNGIEEITDESLTMCSKDIDIKDKNALLIKAAKVPQKVQISTKPDTMKLPMIISMIPGIALHKFDKIKADKISFLDFFQKVMFSIKTAFPKYFYFKKLILSDESSKVTLSNVFVKVQEGSMSSAFINGDKVYFDSNLSKTLSSKVSLKDLLYKHDIKADEIEGINDYLQDKEMGKVLLKVVIEKLLNIPKDLVKPTEINQILYHA